jgi:hypothetical protein
MEFYNVHQTAKNLHILSKKCFLGRLQHVGFLSIISISRLNQVIANKGHLFVTILAYCPISIKSPIR